MYCTKTNSENTKNGIWVTTFTNSTNSNVRVVKMKKISQAGRACSNTAARQAGVVAASFHLI